MSARLALLLSLCGVLACNQIFGVEPPTPRAGDAGPVLNVVYAQCLLPSDCATGETCLFEHCSAPCAQDRDCPDTSVCLQTANGNAACVRLADNHCGAIQACPDGTRCVNERCSSLCDGEHDRGCLNGRECQDGVCVLPSERADAGAAAGAHDAGPAADSGKTEPSDAGVLTAGDPQPDAGSQTPTASAKPVCSPGEQRCTDNAVETCGQDARYGSAVPCDHQACIGGRCFGNCAPDERRCANNAIETCDETGHFVISQACSQQACVNAACVGSCAPRETRCESAASYGVCGESGDWGQLTSCGAAACSGGQCTGSCAPDSRRCKPGAQIAQRCTPDGIWEDRASCTNQACSEGVCSGECAPGHRECSGVGVRECSDLGSFGPVQACRDQACINGNCTGVCAPSNTRCNAAGEVETCSASGTWGGATACRDQACVNGACSGVCAPAQRRCASAGNRVEACDAAGAWQTFQQCSAPAEICKASRCVPNAPVNLGYADVTGWSARSLLDNRMYLLGPFDPGFAADVLAINLTGSASNGASADMFIYQDEMGVPGKLRARASSTLLLTQTNASTDLRPVGTQIPAGGKVWIGAVFFGGPQLPQPTVTTFPTRAYVLSFTFGGAPPDPFPAKNAMLVNGAALPFFLTLRELPL